MPHVTVGTQSLWYDEYGHGRPLLLIPGLGATRLGWWKQIHPFAEHFRVLNIDNRDAGDSAFAPDRYSIADMADDAAGVIAAIGERACDVVGWSMGSFIAQELTLRHPNLVTRLVLVAGSPGGPEAESASQEIRMLLSRDANEPAESRARRTYPILAAPGYMAAHPADLESIVRSQTFRPMPLEAYYRQLGAISQWSGSAARLATMRVPTLVVHGDLDPLLPYANGRFLAEHIPGAWLSTYAGVGHLPPIEAGERFNEEVLAFLHARAD